MTKCEPRASADMMDVALLFIAREERERRAFALFGIFAAEWSAESCNCKNPGLREG